MRAANHREVRARVLAAHADGDIRVENHGSLCLLQVLSQRADRWLDENLDPEAMTFGRAYVVEPRYVADIVAGAREAGLEVR